MAKTTLFYYARTDDSNTSTFLPMGSASHQIVGSATEAKQQAVIGAAGTLSDLWVRVAAGGSGRKVTVRNGGSDTSITVTASGAGEFTDAVNTDAVSANDKINFGITVGAITPEYFSCVFDATSDTVFLLNIIDNNGINVSDTDFHLLNFFIISTILISQAHTLRSAGTFTRTYIFVNSNTSTDTNSSTVFINGSSTAQSVTIPASTTGMLEYTGAAISYSAGDTVQIETVEGNGAMNFQGAGATFISTDSKQDCIGSMQGARTASATVHYWPISGREVDNLTTEARVKHSMQYDGTASNLRIHAPSNSYSGNATFTLRKNGVDTAVTLSHTAGSTSLIEDTTHTVTFVAGDDLSLSYTGGSSGIIGTNTTWALTLEADIAGGTTFEKTVAAAGVGTAVLSRVARFPKTIATSGVGTAVLSRLKTVAKTIAASAIGTAAFAVALVKPITIAATAIGTAVFSVSFVKPITIAATAVGTAALSRLKTVKKTIAASGVGTAVVSRVKTVAQTIAASGVGTAALTKIARFPKTIAASGIGTAALSRLKTIAKTIAATAVGTASVVASFTIGITIGITIAATAIGTASISRLKTVAITIAATAIGTVNIIVVYCIEYLLAAFDRFVTKLADITTAPILTSAPILDTELVEAAVTNTTLDTFGDITTAPILTSAPIVDTELVEAGITNTTIDTLGDVTTENVYINSSILDTSTVSAPISDNDILVLADMREQIIYLKAEICE